jgi:hypothetical protein
VWEELIDSNKVGFMALLRNLRNMIQAEISSDHLDKVCSVLSDPEQVARSKQLPFRFLSAYRMLTGWPLGCGNLNLNQKYVNTVVEALEKAMVASAQNLPNFDDSVFATDVSGSMQHNISDKSVIQLYDVGTVMCMMAYLKSKSSVTGMFGDIFKIVNFPKENILRNANEIHKREGEAGYSTNGHLVLEWALKQKEDYNNFYFFTDCQIYNSRGRTSSIVELWNEYRKRNPKANVFFFDLSGYSTIPLSMHGNGVHLIAGWSNEVFSVLENISKSETAIDAINQVEF